MVAVVLLTGYNVTRSNYSQAKTQKTTHITGQRCQHAITKPHPEAISSFTRINCQWRIVVVTFCVLLFGYLSLLSPSTAQTIREKFTFYSCKAVHIKPALAKWKSRSFLRCYGRRRRYFWPPFSIALYYRHTCLYRLVEKYGMLGLTLLWVQTDRHKQRLRIEADLGEKTCAGDNRP